MGLLGQWISVFVSERPGWTQLNARAETLIEQYDQAQEQKERAYRDQGETLVDPEGFVLVQPRKKTKAHPSDQDKKVLARKQVGKPDFYQFQVKQFKFNEKQEIRRKFELDKQRLAKMKETRKFRPV